MTLKRPEVFSIKGTINEEGSIEVVAETCEEDGTVKEKSVILATFASIVDYLVKHSMGTFTIDSLFEVTKKHLQDPEIQRVEWPVEETNSSKKNWTM